jgi:hypothetical protein
MSGMDFSEYRAKLVQLGADLDESARRTLTRMNAKGMEVTKKATPTGKYPSIVTFTTKEGKVVSFKVTPKIGGTAKKNWINGGTHRAGNGYESRYYNNTFYIGYVNDGHRVVNRRGETVGYQEGVRMLEQGQNAARQSADAIFNAEIQRVKQKGGW